MRNPEKFVFHFKISHFHKLHRFLNHILVFRAEIHQDRSVDRNPSIFSSRLWTHTNNLLAIRNQKTLPSQSWTTQGIVTAFSKISRTQGSRDIWYLRTPYKSFWNGVCTPSARLKRRGEKSKYCTLWFVMNGLSGIGKTVRTKFEVHTAWTLRIGMDGRRYGEKSPRVDPKVSRIFAKRELNFFFIVSLHNLCLLGATKLREWKLLGSPTRDSFWTRSGGSEFFRVWPKSSPKLHRPSTSVYPLNTGNICNGERLSISRLAIRRPIENGQEAIEGWRASTPFLTFYPLISQLIPSERTTEHQKRVVPPPTGSTEMLSHDRDIFVSLNTEFRISKPSTTRFAQNTLSQAYVYTFDGF